jgi:ribosomal protein L37AE/L43A
MEKQVCPHCKKEFMPDHTPCTYCCRKCQLEGAKNRRLVDEEMRKELELPRRKYRI